MQRETSFIILMGLVCLVQLVVGNTSITFPFELPKNINYIALSPNGSLLVAVDMAGQGVLVSVSHRVVLHHINFHEPVHCLSFSPDGSRLVVAMGGRVRIWRTPGIVREFAPLALDFTIGGHTDSIISLDWSLDSRYLLTASEDMTARVLDLKKDELNPQYKPVELRGHKHPLKGAYFSQDDQSIITVAKNGGVCVWSFDPKRGMLSNIRPVNRYQMQKQQPENNDDSNDESQKMPIVNKSKVTAVTFEKDHNLLVASFADGVFSIFKIDSIFERIYSLGLTQAQIATLAINKTGEWIAMGISDHGQLLVWEWKSESFILKQQGHSSPMQSIAYSSDGQTIATGCSDGRLKLWNAQAALCFVTFSEHTAAVSAVEFTKNGKVVVSASNDGTVRAFDMLRYRNFRIFTTPTPVQFLSLAVDPSGEIIAAGTLDTFEIFLWSMQTGQLLEIISGHTGPISSLAFDPIGHCLASGSWDRTVRLWDVFQRNKNMQVLDHSSEIISLAFRPDGHQIATANLRGEILTWDVELATCTTTIDCRRDISDKALSTATLKSISYTPDGNVILAAGTFAFVAFYDVASRNLLRRFPISQIRRNKSSEEPSTEIVVPAVRMSPTNRSFAALSPEGLILYSLDDNLAFDPFDLEIDLTPERINNVLNDERDYLKAFVMSLRLNITSVTTLVHRAIPVDSIPLIVRGLPPKYLLPALNFLANLTSTSHQLQLILRWISAILGEHALLIRHQRVKFSPILRLLLRNLQVLYGDLSKVSNQTMFMLDYMVDAALV